MPGTRDLSELAGALIVCGFPGEALDGATRDALSARRRAGVILFRRNVRSVEQTHALCTDIVGARGAAPGPLVAVDQEGGRVMRLPSPAVQLPPMRVLGEIGDAALVERAAAVVAKELSAIGFNVDFAPVLDVDSNPENPVIGDRSFGRDAGQVAELGSAFARGLEDSGVLACGKHFPGHGDTDKDSHLDLPVVKHPRPRLDEVELRPFREARDVVSSLMTAHVVFDALDPGVPATLSERIVGGLLRRDIGYRGLVFSDDLEMRALADRYTVEEAAVGAIRAGCDVLLVCHGFDVAERAHGALVREAERDSAFRARCEEAAARCADVRRRFPARPVRGGAALISALAAAGGAALLDEIAARRA